MPFKKIPPLYAVWQSMRRRCLAPSTKQWEDYGGRGIRICERWNVYQNFVDDMGERPPGTSLDRIDNDGNYEPGNCRWATQKEQQRNQRRAVFVTIEGQKYRAIELAETYNLKTDTIVDRASKGMSFAEVVQPQKHVYKAGLALGGRVSGLKRSSSKHCRNGHEMTPENTRTTLEGWRNCRECARIKEAVRREAKRAKLV